MPRIRGRLYSSCASSTCSFPSALVACWAKMSRINCVRSTTRAVERVLERPLLRRLELAVDEQDLRLRVAVDLLQLFELALAHIGARIGACTLLHELADRLDTRGAGKLAKLTQLLLGVGGLWENGQDEPAFGLDARWVADASSRWGLCHACRRCPPSPTGLPLARSSSSNIRSESRNEAEIRLRTSREPRSFGPDVRRSRARLSGTATAPAMRPLVVLAGHLDTVPAQENVPGERTAKAPSWALAPAT